MKKLRFLTILVVAALVAACGDAAQSPDAEATTSEHEGHDHDAMAGEAAVTEFKAAPEGAKVFFVNLKEGDKVKSPVKVVMGAEGITVHPAGEVVDGTGHHHILVDTEGAAAGTTVPADAQHIHFGGGQTEAEIELTPGMHKLSLQFADGLHRSYGEQLSATINIEVLPNE